MMPRLTPTYFTTAFAAIAIAFAGCGSKSSSDDDAAPNTHAPAPALVPQGDEPPATDNSQSGGTTADTGSGAPGELPVVDPGAPPPASTDIPKSNLPHPDIALVSVSNLTFAGTACPAGSLGTAVFDTDLATLTVTWPASVDSQAGPGVSITRNRRQCSSSLLIHAPADWVYRLVKVTAKADSRLDAGASAKTIAQAYFQGSQVTAEYVEDRLGPVQTSADVTGDFVTEWSPLNVSRALNLKLDSRASVDPAASGATASHSVANQSVYVVEWEYRPAPTPVP